MAIMRLGILLFSRPKDGNANLASLMEAARARGHEVTVLYEPLLLIRHLTDRVEILHDGHPLPLLDVILPRPDFVEEPSLHTVTVDALLAAGYPVVNAHHAFPLTKNKLVQKLVLTQEHIPTPNWAIVRSPENTERAAASLGYPLILKVAFGTWGKGVFYVENRATLMPIADYLHVRDKNPVIMEEFIAEADRHDLRVFVVNGRVIGAMERVARDGDVRANIYAQATDRTATLTDEEKRIACAATKAFDLDLAGVDLIRSRRGPLVLEVNANPGFAALTKVTGIDIASHIIAFAETRAAT